MIPNANRWTIWNARFGPWIVGTASLLMSWIAMLSFPAPVSAQSMSETCQKVQPKIAKIYGAGGISGLEAYQSGIVISADGHVLTAFSYVLDTDDIGVYLSDGRRFAGTLVGVDPRTELAILKIEAEELPHFDVQQSIDLETGDRILAFGNLYGIATGDEPVTVLHGTVSAVTELAGRRGAFKTPYRGPIYVVDAVTNNAGAAGGALTDSQGRLAGLLAKETRGSDTNVWLNFAIPMSAVKASISAMKNGTVQATNEDDSVPSAASPWTLRQLGIVLMPDLLSRTPPFVESVLSGTPAAQAGIRPDDLVLYVGNTITRSCRDLIDQLRRVEQMDDLELTVRRNHQLISLTIEPLHE